MYEAVVLAAGYSSRFGKNKLAVMIDGKPVLCHVIDAFKPVCSRITVVGGRYYDEISELVLDYEKVHMVYNKDFRKGMFSSVLCGIKNVSGACFISPGDYPLLTFETVLAMTKAEGEFIVPKYNGKRGHPVLLSREAVERLKAEPVDSDLRRFRDKCRVADVEVDHPGVVWDMDTPEDFERLAEKRSE